MITMVVRKLWKKTGNALYFMWDIVLTDCREPHQITQDIKSFGWYLVAAPFMLLGKLLDKISGEPVDDQWSWNNESDFHRFGLWTKAAINFTLIPAAISSFVFEAVWAFFLFAFTLANSIVLFSVSAALTAVAVVAISMIGIAQGISNQFCCSTQDPLQLVPPAISPELRQIGVFRGYSRILDDEERSGNDDRPRGPLDDLDVAHLSNISENSAVRTLPSPN